MSFSHGFVNWPGGDLVNLFHVGLEKACSDNLAEFPVTFTHVSRAGGTSVSWRLDSQAER